MSETTWIQIRKKRRRGKVFLVILVCLVIAGIIVRNNRDILLQQFHALGAGAPKKQTFKLQTPLQSPDTAASVQATEPAETSSQDNTAMPPPAPANQNVVSKMASQKTPLPDGPKAEDFSEGPPRTVSAPAPLLVQQSVMLEKIPCRIRDRSDLRVIIGLELLFSGDSARQEIMLKREDLKVMVLQVFKGKSLDDMVVESLRPEIKIALNRIITHAPITDIEFRDFRIEKE
jgi:hypothetical protein